MSKGAFDGGGSGLGGGLAMAAEIGTRLQPAASAESIPASEVLIAGAASGHTVSGAVLEAAVRWGDRFVLFMTDDTPFEEQLGIHLLDSAGKTLDSATLGGPYTTGSFAALRLIEPNTIGFRFIGDTDWAVELLAQPTWRLPLIGDPPGVRRALGFSRHFLVHGRPQPQAA